MLPKSKRLSRKEFSLLVKNAPCFQNNLFLLRFLNKDLKDSKISFSVSKKVSKNAVVRNRLRRLGYRAAKNFIDKIKNNLIALSFKEVAKDFDQVSAELKDVLSKSKII